MSTSVTFNPQRVGAAGWQLAQTLWVGGLWLLHFVVVPALSSIGLAPLLIDTLSSALRPLLVALALGCAALQLLLLVFAEGVASCWQDKRGHLLLAVLGLAGVYLATHYGLPGALWWLRFNFLLLAFAGLLLVLQPVPGAGGQQC